MKTSHVRLVTLPAFLMATLVGTATFASDSPEAAFDGVRKAIKKGNYSAIVDHVAPSERTLMAFSLDMGVDMAVSFWEGDEAEAAQKSYNSLREKFKVKSKHFDRITRPFADKAEQKVRQGFGGVGAWFCSFIRAGAIFYDGSRRWGGNCLG